MKLTREQRMLNTIRRKAVDYLPSNIAFADVTRNDAIAKQLGLGGEEELPDYLDNHLHFIMLGIDAPIIYRNDVAAMQKLVQQGLAGLDLENGVVYDSWGVGIKMHVEGFFPCYHPLQQKSELNKRAYGFLPKSFPRDLIFFDDIERAMDEFVAPDALSKINFAGIAEQLADDSEDALRVLCGYGGLFERAYHVLGYEELMMYMALYPEALGRFLDKITEHKINIAKRAVELGAKMGHLGDDLGTQLGMMFSKEMFRKYFKPRYREIFEVYHKAGIPVQMHSCGNVTEVIPELIDIGLTVLEPVQPVMDLKMIKREYGKDLIFYGGIDTQVHLPHMTPEQVKTMVRETIHTLGKGGGYIIAPAQEITIDVPIENIKALIETVMIEREKVLE